LRSLAQSSELGAARTRVQSTEMTEIELGKRMMLMVPDLDKKEKAHEKHLPTGEQAAFYA